MINLEKGGFGSMSVSDTSRGDLSEVRETAIVRAPLDRVWALSTRVELVRDTLGMKLVGGTTGGFIGDGSRVVWRGWKFGLPTEHHTLITGFRPPYDLERGERAAWFQDSQEQGRFQSFQHDHAFREMHTQTDGAVTILGDHVRFSLPLLIGGALSSALLLRPYVASLVRRRYAILKEMAEGEGWRAWL